MPTTNLIDAIKESDGKAGSFMPPTITGLDSSSVYRLVYKDRSKIETIHFHFVCKMDEFPFNELDLAKRPAAIARERLQRAIERCKKYCEAMRYRFIHCELFLVNLDEKERMASESY